MKKEFQFLAKRYSLSMESSAEVEGNFHKCAGKVHNGRTTCNGIFKLTQLAWEKANQKAKDKQRPLDEVLVDGCVQALKAELYIREIPDGFTYVTDHRFFENLFS